MIRPLGLFKRASRREAAGSEATRGSTADSGAPASQIGGAHPGQRPSGRTRYGLAALVGIFTIGIVTLSLVDLHSRYLAAIAEAERSAGISAEVLAEQTARTFEALSLTLDAAIRVRKNATAGVYPIEMANRALQLLQFSAPHIVGIGWTNATGDFVAYSYETDPPRLNIADLPYFAAQRDGEGGTFLIARPFRSVANGRWNIAVSRRLNNPDGSFAGILSAAIDPMLQLSQPDLLQIFLYALVESSLAPERLELEITETALFKGDVDYATLIRQLKKLGVSIALDDFGTGYSSLSYLTMFPFDKIKIDRSFTMNLTRRADCAAIISAVLALGRGLETDTVAEGVETEQQFEILRAAGVTYVQGYLFGHPCAVSELAFGDAAPMGLVDSATLVPDNGSPVILETDLRYEHTSNAD